MFAVKDKRSGKFLKSFSGSLNKFNWHTLYKIYKAKNNKNSEFKLSHANIWSQT